MRCPSGDHDGYRDSLSLVIGVRLVPSAFIIQMSWFPYRVETNAMRCPSGDHDGSESMWVVFVIGVRLEPSASMT